MSYADETHDQSGSGGGSWLNDVLDVFSPQPPAPPSPKTPSPSPDTEIPGTPQYKLVQAQDAIRNNDAYAPKVDPRTGKVLQSFCNVAAGETVRAMGGPLQDLMYSSGEYVEANNAANHLQASKNWQQVSAIEAQDLANQGTVVIGVQRYPGSDPSTGMPNHGHMVTVRPEDHPGLAEMQGEAPIVNNIGARRNVVPADQAFPDGTRPVRYYAPRQR